ncbi:MAG: hypothetical protein ACR2G3_11530 [Solirubrobacterales bacterium]
MEPTTTTASGNGQAATTSAQPKGPVEQRLYDLRTLAKGDPAAAQAAAWQWFQDAGKRIGSDRGEAIADLNELFNSGTPSEGIDGQTEGILVGFTMHSIPDRLLALVTGGWMPWAGKRFDAANAKGDNLLAKSAKWPAKLLWPLYGTKDTGENLTAFDFTTRVEKGADDPELDVLVIDYAPVDSNPRVVIKSIRDELVEVVPGTHLGKMLWRRGPYEDARYSLLAFFALKTPVA